MIYLMRHGETDWNAVRRIQGHTDIPLNARGVQAMEAAGQRLRDLGFRVDCMASSPLKRAAETARIIGTQIGYDGEILCEPDLIERSFGKAEGISLLDHPDLTDETYGVEKMEDLRQRVERVLNRYRADRDHDWLLVTHGAFIMAAMDLLCGSEQGAAYLSLPDQGNPIAVTERDGVTTCTYLLSNRREGE